MKKLILALAILFSMDVYAKPLYTEYDFVGYTVDELETDDLHRYDTVYMNKFYKMIKINEEYLELDSIDAKEFFDETDFQSTKVLSKTPNTKYENTSMILIEGRDNYLTRKVVISDIKDGLEIKEIEIYNLDTPLKISIPNCDSLIDGKIEDGCNIAGDIEIALNTVAYVDNLKIIIYYETEEDAALTITPINSSGLLRISQNVTLDKDTDKVEISTSKYDKYALFLESMNYDYEPVTYYYSYNILKYKFYDLAKEYFIMSELDYIEGYTYDPIESIKMYKIYEREYLGEEPEEKEEPYEPIETKKEEELGLKSTTYIPYTVYSDRKDIDSKEEIDTETEHEETEASEKSNADIVCKNDREIYYISIIFILLFVELLRTIHYFYVKRQKSY